MKTPQKFYRIMSIADNGTLHLFETHQFGEPNNWFEKESEAEQWIQEQFLDAHPGSTPNIMALTVVPVWVITFKSLS